jgi:hypothetical protein
MISRFGASIKNVKCAMFDVSPLLLLTISLHTVILYIKNHKSLFFNYEESIKIRYDFNCGKYIKLY